MKKKNKILISIIAVVVILLVIGVSYALWIITSEQNGENVVNTSCLDVTIENEADDISLINTFPKTDEEGLKTTPYTFSVKNNCEEYADYTINLEILNETTLNSEYVKIALNEEENKGVGTKLNAYDIKEIDGSKEGRQIKKGKLKPNEERKYELRLWINEDVTKDDGVEGSIFKSKIMVESVIGEESKPSDEICIGKEESGACYIAKKADIESEEPELMYDETEDRNLRYVSATPNNYIDIGDRTSDGQTILWRIIGVMKNVYNIDTGRQEDLIKIIRANSIGEYSWDTSANEINNGYGVNEWSQADLMKLLNPKEVYNNEEPELGGSLYWNSENGSCYSEKNNVNKPCDFTSNGISVEAREKIAKVRWNTGTFATYNASEWTANATYQAERENIDGKQYCANNGGGNTCNDEVPRTTTWDGYIGLMYPSDFGYAVGGDVRDTCLAKSINNYAVDGCSNADWLKNGFDWTLNPVPFTADATHVFVIHHDLDLYGGFAVWGATDVRPVGFLKPSITISDALGTPEDPYIAS